MRERINNSFGVRVLFESDGCWAFATISHFHTEGETLVHDQATSPDEIVELRDAAIRVAVGNGVPFTEVNLDAKYSSLNAKAADKAFEESQLKVA